MRILMSLLVCMVLIAPVAHATVVYDATLPEMAAASPLVVRAVVTGKKVEWDETRTQIVTRTTLHVTKNIKGSGASEIVVRTIGGELNGRGLQIAGTPSFEPKEDVIVFLQPHPTSSDFVLYSMAASKFTITNSVGKELATRDFHGLTFAHPTATGLAPTDVLPMKTVPVELLLAQVANQTQSHIIAPLTPAFLPLQKVKPLSK